MEDAEVKPIIDHRDEQRMLLGWFRRHGVTVPNEQVFREALQCIIDAKKLDETIPWNWMEREYIPIKIARPKGQKASDLVKHLRLVREQCSKI